MLLFWCSAFVICVYVLTLKIYDDVEGQDDGGGIIVVWKTGNSGSGRQN